MTISTTLLSRANMLIVISACALGFCAPALAQEAQSSPDADLSGFETSPVLDEAFFALAGRYHHGEFDDDFNPFNLDYSDDYLLAVGYQRFFQTDPDGFSIGAELGVGARIGASDPSAELWGGSVARYDGIVLMDSIRISPAITVGLSYVTDTLQMEKSREDSSGDSAALLFYLSPEFNLSLADNPEWEVFWRIQHRSGLWGVLANINGANGTTVGVRRRF